MDGLPSQIVIAFGVKSEFFVIWFWMYSVHWYSAYKSDFTMTPSDFEKKKWSVNWLVNWSVNQTVLCSNCLREAVSNCSLLTGKKIIWKDKQKLPSSTETGYKVKLIKLI